MEKTRAISLSVVAIFLIMIMVLGVVLHYPLNLIVDGIALALVGLASILYVVIWSFLGDRIVICIDHITVRSRRFPIWTVVDRRIYFKDISFYVPHGLDTILILKHGDPVHINRSETEEGIKINDLPGILKDKGIKKLEHKEFIKRRVGKRHSYLSKI